MTRKMIDNKESKIKFKKFWSSKNHQWMLKLREVQNEKQNIYNVSKYLPSQVRKRKTAICLETWQILPYLN
jgi:hypothetical protein